jgi:hypothetical protein
MGQMIVFTVLGISSLILALPWIILFLAPLITVFAFFASLVAKLIVPGLGTFPVPSYNTTALRDVLIRYVAQWPTEVVMFARVIRTQERVRLIVQFKSGNMRWFRATKATCVADAISKMREKLLYGEMPRCTNSDKRFESAFRLKTFIESTDLYPMGLKSQSQLECA